MSRQRHFSAVIQDGNLTTSVVRVHASDPESARRAAVRKAAKLASAAYPDEAVRKLMTRDKFSVSHLFTGHVKDAVT